MFAAQVNNTLSTSETRYVTSSYDLTLGWKEFEGANKLNYFVDTKNVAEINNRFSNTSLSLKEQTATINYNELEWINEAAVKPTEKKYKKKAMTVLANYYTLQCKDKL